MRLYLEIPNVLDVQERNLQKSLLSDLGFSPLVRKHAASLDQILDPTTGDLQKAARILRAFRAGGLLNQRLMNSVMGQAVGRTECNRLLEDEGLNGSNNTVATSASRCQN